MLPALRRCLAGRQPVPGRGAEHVTLPRREPDYEAGLINYAVGDPELDPGLLGYADDNWLDGTQSGVFSFVNPGVAAAGYGLTTTMIHEYGHHSSMSHPHDGYDPQAQTDFDPTGETFFAWLGDESNSIMSYIDVNWDFSQFDRDNSARHHAAGYALIANRIAADILRDRRRDRAAADLEAADRGSSPPSPPSRAATTPACSPTPPPRTGTCGTARTGGRPGHRPPAQHVDRAGEGPLPDEARCDRPPQPREPEARSAVSDR